MINSELWEVFKDWVFALNFNITLVFVESRSNSVILIFIYQQNITVFIWSKKSMTFVYKENTYHARKNSSPFKKCIGCIVNVRLIFQMNVVKWFNNLSKYNITNWSCKLYQNRTSDISQVRDCFMIIMHRAWKVFGYQ